MRLVAFKYLLMAVLLLALGAPAQVVHQVVPVDPPTGAKVTFKFIWDQGHPWVSYTIAVDDAGHTEFEGLGNAADNGDGDRYRQDWIISRETMRRSKRTSPRPARKHWNTTGLQRMGTRS